MVSHKYFEEARKKFDDAYVIILPFEADKYHIEKNGAEYFLGQASCPDFDSILKKLEEEDFPFVYTCNGLDGREFSKLNVLKEKCLKSFLESCNTSIN